MIDVSIVVPAFNEAGIITRTVAEIDAYMQAEMAGSTYEIVVVDDGSRDGMAELLKSVGNPRLRVVKHARNQGRGAALRTGFGAAQGTYIVTLDADLSYAPYHIKALIEPIRGGDADITLASAYHSEGSVKNIPAFRAWISRWGNRVLSTGVYGRFSTLTCMVRGYRRDVIQRMELIASNKDLHIEVLQKANLFGFRIVEVPAHLEWRSKDRANRVKTGLFSSFPLFAMSSTIASHLVYNYVLRPGPTLLVPILGLTAIALAGILVIFVSFLIRLFEARPDTSAPMQFYLALRETLLQGSLTVTLVFACSAAILVFVSLFFVSQQSKKQFEELYILTARMNDRLKELERRDCD